ncbi:hypothetical protein SPF06_19955 [Sinomonas sp. JGH33]|uniref:Uncharacterized protein n=1 Tax=Sinomonas terricola TaxID=3110330 RepID=A0ABU5TBZ3_9MICC|nr:hypothetical protein [Sinomonas sp. JGH33]MEA5457004.1 hypothetical protein [Sinomonas sp. JGH33]
MYRAIWRILPGSIAVRIAILVLLAGAILVALDLWVFPWMAVTFVDDRGTVGSGA